MSEKFIAFCNIEVLCLVTKISKSKMQNAGQLGVRIVKHGLINIWFVTWLRTICPNLEKSLVFKFRWSFTGENFLRYISVKDSTFKLRKKKKVSF